MVGGYLVRRQLPLVPSTVAGRVGVIGFLALGGPFTARIGGNIVVLAARFVAGDQAPLSHLPAVPVFVLVRGVSLTCAPSTAVMTTRATVFAMEIGKILLAPDTSRIAKVRANAPDKPGQRTPASLSAASSVRQANISSACIHSQCR